MRKPDLFESVYFVFCFAVVFFGFIAFFATGEDGAGAPFWPKVAAILVISASYTALYLAWKLIRRKMTAWHAPAEKRPHP